MSEAVKKFVVCRTDTGRYLRVVAEARRINLGGAPVLLFSPEVEHATGMMLVSWLRSIWQAVANSVFPIWCLDSTRSNEGPKKFILTHLSFLKRPHFITLKNIKQAVLQSAIGCAMLCVMRLGKL